MEWLKNKNEIFQFLSDMEKNNQVANLDNYIKWANKHSVILTQTRKTEYSTISLLVSDKQKQILVY